MVQEKGREMLISRQVWQLKNKKLPSIAKGQSEAFCGKFLVFKERIVLELVREFPNKL